MKNLIKLFFALLIVSLFLSCNKPKNNRAKTIIKKEKLVITNNKIEIDTLLSLQKKEDSVIKQKVNQKQIKRNKPKKKKQITINKQINCNNTDLKITKNDTIARVLIKRRGGNCYFKWNSFNDTLVISSSSLCIKRFYFNVKGDCPIYLGHSIFGSDDDDYSAPYQDTFTLKKPSSRNYFTLQEWKKNKRLVGQVTYKDDGSLIKVSKFWMEITKKNKTKFK